MPGSVYVSRRRGHGRAGLRRLRQARPAGTAAGRSAHEPALRRRRARHGGSESGLGFPSYGWRKVQPALERLTRTCSYDRAGLGFSDPGPLPRSADAVADDLPAMLLTAGLRPPYLLVANSPGSQPSRLLAFRHRDEVGGMVLVDPYVEGQNEVLDRIKPPQSGRRRACAT